MRLRGFGITLCLGTLLFGATSFGASASADDSLPLPVDTNCTYKYGVTLSQSGTARTTISDYHGHTTCSQQVASIDAYATLFNSSGVAVSNGPYHTCGPCTNLGSTGGPYGPVSYASAWTVQYDSTVVLTSSENWQGYDKKNCSQSGKVLSCVYELTFAPVATGTFDLEDVAVAL